MPPKEAVCGAWFQRVTSERWDWRLVLTSRGQQAHLLESPTGVGQKHIRLVRYGLLPVSLALSEPFRRGHSYTLRKNSRQSGRIGISHGGEPEKGLKWRLRESSRGAPAERH